MSRNISFVAALLASLLVFAPSAFACKCAQRSVAEGLADAAAVFEGRVTQIEKVLEPGETEARQLRVTLSVVRVWKSLERVESVTVLTNSEPAACGFYFEPGQAYLVYANRADGEPDLHVHSCSRTRPMRDAGEDLATLGGGVTPVKIDLPSTPKGNTDEPVSKQEEANAPKAQRGCALAPAADNAGPGAGLMLLLAGLWLARRRRRG